MPHSVFLSHLEPAKDKVATPNRTASDEDSTQLTFAAQTHAGLDKDCTKVRAYSPICA